MKIQFAMLPLLFLLFCTTGAAAQEVMPAPDLGAQVQGVFATKCSQCHGPALARPKGKFGFVTDLPRLARARGLVMRFDPGASKLWKQIDAGDMPPDTSRAGPLSEGEKRLIHLWIEAGAPAPLGTQPATETLDAPAAVAPSLFSRLMELLGKFHILVIHFPIALLAAAALAESWAIVRKHPGQSDVVRFCVLLGAGGALVAGALGWVHAAFGGFGAGEGHALSLHRWLGAAAAVAALAAALACQADVLRARRSRLFRALLFTTAALTTAAAHVGGLLVHGPDFLHL